MQKYPGTKRVVNNRGTLVKLKQNRLTIDHKRRTNKSKRLIIHRSSLLCAEHPDIHSYMGMQGATPQPRPEDDEGSRSARGPRTFFFLNAGRRPARRMMSGCQEHLVDRVIILAAVNVLHV